VKQCATAYRPILGRQPKTYGTFSSSPPKVRKSYMLVFEKMPRKITPFPAVFDTKKNGLEIAYNFASTHRKQIVL
jgi:hypothetical protein